MPEIESVTLRLASGSDGAALERLAGRDSRRLLPGLYLVAEREGTIDAAIRLESGELLADPFRHTAELGELLRRRARAIPAVPKRRRPGLRRLRPVLGGA